SPPCFRLQTNPLSSAQRSGSRRGSLSSSHSIPIWFSNPPTSSQYRTFHSLSRGVRVGGLRHRVFDRSLHRTGGVPCADRDPPAAVREVADLKTGRVEHLVPGSARRGQVQRGSQCCR